MTDLDDGNGISVLLVDDDATFRRALAGALGRRGLRVAAAGNAEEAVSRALEDDWEVALLDLKMPGKNGIELMEELRRNRPDVPVVILTGHGTIPSAIEAIQRGAFNYLQKPCEVDEVELTVRNAARQRSLSLENARLREIIRRSSPYQGIVGRSPAVRHMIEVIERTKESWSPVLIQGESGTGKELVARALHSSSSRHERPFVAINCAGLKPELLENELFGHVGGAFTGASRAKSGLFEVADGGTLFIDEIVDMDATIQASLLRVVESGVFRPLGSTREKRVRVRIIAAANRDLHEASRTGRFRSDLLYRLDVVHIVVPPLRERKEDIPLLVQHYLNRSREAREKEVVLTSGAMEALQAYDFPGNVRELFGVLERAILLSRDGSLDAAAIGSVLRPGSGSPGPPPGLTLEERERQHISEMLRRERGNVSRVSSLLGIDRRTLQRKMKRYGLR